MLIHGTPLHLRPASVLWLEQVALAEQIVVEEEHGVGVEHQREAARPEDEPPVLRDLEHAEDEEHDEQHESDVGDALPARVAREERLRPEEETQTGPAEESHGDHKFGERPAVRASATGVVTRHVKPARYCFVLDREATDQSVQRG